jgi:6-pyruvoyltetrahydropterin/6-carboxytetrahydropterin synthase
MAEPFEIYKEFRFEAAHRLAYAPPGHRCARLHGHSFRCRVRVGGALRQPQDWVMDFAGIARAFEPLHELLDHNYLNDIPGLENPTAENLARWVYERLAPALPGLSGVEIKETCTAGCVYRGPAVEPGANGLKSA